MKVQPLFRFALLLLRGVAATGHTPTVVDQPHQVTYHGIERNGIEVFLNIPYGLDTGGEHRFKPPRPHVPVPGSVVDAQAYGIACPQLLGPWFPPLTLANVSEVSEDCLNLNVARPKGLCSTDRLPVMVYIHGGSFWIGQNSEITVGPDGLVLESVRNGLPVIHVAMNYRLGCKWRSVTGCGLKLITVATLKSLDLRNQVHSSRKGPRMPG